MKNRILDWYYTFPIQLLVLHMRSNIFFLFLWLITLALATGLAGLRFGWMYLFLTPEYLEEVGFWSFMLVGLTFGGFVVTWNVTSYILYSPQFPFLASLQRPFTKFFMNNGLIPLGFLIIYVWAMIRHQWYYELWSGSDIFYNMLGFVFGFFITLILTIIYFEYTNKDIFSFKNAIIRPPNLDKPAIRGNKTATIENITAPEFTRVRSYLNESFRWRPVRNVAHYEEHYLYKVFRQNHFNAVVVQCVSIMFLILTGYMIENPYFRLPAAASFFILLSVISSIAALLFYWLHKWTNLFIVVLVLLVNTATKFDMFEFKNRAFGLEYDKTPLDYSYETMDSVHQEKFVEEDKAAMLQILEKWKARIPKGKLREKPKMVLVGTSGGGLRAGLWTMQVLQQADKITNGKFMQNTSMVTGASGGMFALAYYRELYLKKQQGEDIQLDDQVYLDNTGKDLLNSIMYTMVSSDLFMPWSKFEINGQRYAKDRGYMFEKQFNQNTDGLID
ncbi:MAG: patatin-like phospholipase family protein, partial [Saprospiraceae bacterium]